MIIHAYPSYLIALLATATLIYFLKRRAIRIGLVDRLGTPKHERVETPLIGGLAIFCGFMLSLLISDISVHSPGSFFSASLVLILVGMLDDLHRLSFKFRFAAQIVAALLMILWGGVVLHDLGALSFDDSLFNLGIMAIPFTVFATVGATNALNMSDGMDGQAGSLTLVALLGFVVVTYITGRYVELTILLLLASALVAFLAFNVRMPWQPRASVFLGDAGSMFLGFTLAWFAIYLSQGEQRAMSPVVTLWFLMLPLFDTVGMMLRRIWIGRSPFHADREHFHHVLLFAGYSVNQAVLIMVGLALAGVMVGLGGWFLGVPDIVMFAAFLGLFGFYLWEMMHAWKVMRLFGRPICRRYSPVNRRAGQDRRAAVINLTQLSHGSDRRAGLDRRTLADRRVNSIEQGVTLHNKSAVAAHATMQKRSGL